MLALARVLGDSGAEKESSSELASRLLSCSTVGGGWQSDALTVGKASESFGSGNDRSVVVYDDGRRSRASGCCSSGFSVGKLGLGDRTQPDRSDQAGARGCGRRDPARGRRQTTVGEQKEQLRWCRGYTNNNNDDDGEPRGCSRNRSSSILRRWCGESGKIASHNRAMVTGAVGTQRPSGWVGPGGKKGDARSSTLQLAPSTAGDSRPGLPASAPISPHLRTLWRR